MKQNKMMVLQLALVLVMAFSPIVLNAADTSAVPAEGITQGEFAMWLVDAAGAQGKLPPAALQSDAIKFLSDLGIKPKDGWDSDKKLTRDDILDMLGVSKEEGAKLAGKSWEELVNMIVENVINVISQVSATSSGTSVSPSISPGGSR